MLPEENLPMNHAYVPYSLSERMLPKYRNWYLSWLEPLFTTLYCISLFTRLAQTTCYAPMFPTPFCSAQRHPFYHSLQVSPGAVSARSANTMSAAVLWLGHQLGATECLWTDRVPPAASHPPDLEIQLHMCNNKPLVRCYISSVYVTFSCLSHP